MKNIRTRQILFISLFFLGAVCVQAQRIIVPLNKEWRFIDQDPVGAFSPDFDDSSWRLLDLPHDYSIEGAYDPKNTPQNSWLPITDCWYRKTFTYDNSWKDKLVYLWFDGAYMDSEVYVNGKLAGRRPYGFISFYFNITDLLHEGDNLISVRLKNSPAPTSRFYHATSIYGETKLYVVSPAHIPVSGGVFYQVESCSPEKATLKIKTEVYNRAHLKRNLSIRHTLKDASGREASKKEIPKVQLLSQTKDTLVMQCEIDNPRLWDTDSPYLYALETELISDNAIIDHVTTQVGIRSIRYDNKTGFYLNGRNLKLKGVCEHMEMMPVGQAIPDDLWYKRITLLKEMGCNAIRTAHNPFPPKFYELCDELGMMVVDEIFDGWNMKNANDYGGRFFFDWWRTDAEDWIRRDRNHPSIIMWSIGNETGHEDVNHITEWIHRHDDHTRPTSGGNVMFGTDISGFTGQGGMPGALEKFHEENPERAIVLTEVPHTIQTRGFYRVPTWWRDKGGAVNEIRPYGTRQIFFDGLPTYRSSYDNCAVRMNARTCWKRTKNTPWIIGEFRWTGYECFGEAQFMGIEFPKRTYNAGVIDLAGFPKDHFYFYQSQWTDKPMVHILPHWTHPELKSGTVIPVVAYSNCEEVELFLNGKSLGKQRISDLLDFVWNVPYVPGTIKAVAYNKGRIVATKEHKTASAPVQLVLAVHSKYQMNADHKVVYVDVSSTDKKGNFVPRTCNEVLFRVDGETAILGFENGNPIDGTGNKEQRRNLFYGLARGFFQNTTDHNPVKITVAAILGDTLFREHAQVAIDVAFVNLRGAEEKENFAIYYTLDGTEPDRKSSKYTKPFTLDSDCRIRARVYKKEECIFDLQQNFHKGERPPFIDPMLQTDEVLKNKFTGPFDKEITGKWTTDDKILYFEESGSLFEFDANDYRPKLVGQWWYDYPNDKFENPDDMGKGQIRWEKGQRVSDFHLVRGNEDLLEIMVGDETIRAQRLVVKRNTPIP